MRVLQVLPALEVGGVERGTVDLARELVRRGHRAYVISSGGRLVGELVKAGAKHVTLPVHRKSLFSLALVPQIRALIERERIDIVHARSRVPAWLAYWAVRGTGAQFVSTCHGYYSKRFTGRVMGWGRRVIVISRVVGRHMVEDFGVPPARIRLIHRGVAFAPFHFNAEKFAEAARTERFRIVSAGRLTPIKGIEVLIRAFQRVAAQFPRAELHVVGGPEPGKESYAAELAALARHLGLGSRVTWHGQADHLAPHLEAAHVVVLATTKPEAFGRVLVEGAACGAVPVATANGGALDIVRDGETGRLVPPGDAEALAQTLADLLADPGRLREMAERAQRDVRERFDLATMVDKTLEVYDEVVHEQRILVVKLGALGDVVLATPTFRALKKKYPKGKLTVLTDQAFETVLAMSGDVDEIQTIQRGRLRSRPGAWLRLAGRLRREHFDLCVDLQNTWRTHLMALAAGIPRRLGFRRGPMAWCLTDRVAREAARLSPVEQQGRLLARLGILHFDPALHLRLPEGLSNALGSRLAEEWIGAGQGYVVFAAGASRDWPSKQWKAERFRELAGRLHQAFGRRVILVGDNHEQPRAREILKGAADGAIANWVGKTTLPELAALIARADLVVTGDSAPLHLAAAFGTPAMAFFGPTDPARHLPPGRVRALYRRAVPCQPCYSGTCRWHEPQACLAAITVDDAFAVAGDLLGHVKQAASREAGS